MRDSAVLYKRLEIGAHGLAGDGLGRYSTSTLPDATARPDGTLALLTSGSALGSAEWHATPRFDLYAYYGGEYAKRAFYPTGKFDHDDADAGHRRTLSGQPIVDGYGCADQHRCWVATWKFCPLLRPTAAGDVPGSTLGCMADNRNIQEGTLG